MARLLRRRLRAFRAARAGSVAIMTALVAGLMFGMAAITVDIGRFYYLKRRQQMVTDLAAMAAAANLNNASAAATANLVSNGIPATALASIEFGTYVADPTVAASRRFTPGSGSGANAVRVTLKSNPSTFFGAFVGSTGAAIGTRSVGVNQNVADFALGSTLANLDGGMANAILGGLTGTTLNLSVLDYQALASANVDLFGLANALAVRIGAQNGTYGSLASTNVRLADVLSAAADAGANSGMSSTAIAALRNIAAAIGSSGPTLTFGSLASFASYGNLAIGSPAPIGAALPVLPLVSAAARLGAGNAQVQSTLGSSPPSLLGGTIKISVGAPPVGSSFAAVGPYGTTLHTAQTRVLLTLQLAGLGTITGLNLPLYVETASATARIAAIGCVAGSPVEPPVTLGVAPGAVDGWIGAVSPSDFANMSTAPNPGAATLTNVGLLAVTGRAHATIANLAETLVPFSSADIAAGTVKSTATTDYTSSLVSQLIGSLQLNANLVGVNVAVPAIVTSTIGQLLRNDLSLIDTELSNALSLLGVTVGDADTWVRGVRCGQGALVN